MCATCVRGVYQGPRGHFSMCDFDHTGRISGRIVHRGVLRQPGQMVLCRCVTRMFPPRRGSSPNSHVRRWQRISTFPPGTFDPGCRNAVLTLGRAGENPCLERPVAPAGTHQLQQGELQMILRPHFGHRGKRLAVPVASVVMAAMSLTGAGLATVAAAASPAPVTVVATSSAKQTVAKSTFVAAPVSTSAAATLLLLVASDGPTSGAQSVRSVTGCGLTWSLVKRANSSLGVYEAWTATAPAAVTS